MVTINGIKMGAGIPKICVPIIEKEENNIIEEALRVSKAQCDVVEWRIDFYENVDDCDKVVDTLAKVRKAIGEEKILLVTFRTKAEGGQRAIEPKSYEELLIKVIESGYAHLVDVEVFIGDEVFTNIVSKAKLNGCYIIASNHDFEKTPPTEEIVSRLLRMYELGADISKIAVMPQNMADVARLLEATAIMKDEHSEVTVVTMSMGKNGAISRVAGEIFGSAMTFGTISKASAPGQVEIGKLKEIMKNINEL